MTGKNVQEETPEDWDERFSGGWQSAGGSYQSLQFGQIAINFLRTHLKDVLENWATISIEDGTLSCTNYTLHDYGCALGDGTALLRTVFPTANVTGFDHSPKAVELARERWPTLNFEVGSVLDPKPATVIFSSHTLEHVPDVAKTINNLLENCLMLLVLVPEITEKNFGGHDGAELTAEWTKNVPDPAFQGRAENYRRDPENGEGIVETSLVFCWIKQPQA